jgi:energy-coupling factor transport system permease protein
VPVIVPVFMGALRRADGMAMALEARGFQSQRPRTAFEHYRFGALDAGALLLVAGLAGFYLILWRMGVTAIR